MPLSKFVKNSADRQEYIDTLADKYNDDVIRIAQELYNDPERRRDVITLDFLQDGIDRAILAGMDEGYVETKWEQISELVDLPLDDLAAIQPRSDEVAIAMSIILAASKEQAHIESGMIAESMQIGKQAGQEQARVTKGLSKAELKKAPYHIKAELERRKNERRENTH